MKRYRSYRTEAEAEEAGRQTAHRVRHGIAGSKYYPDYATALRQSIDVCRASAARVAHDPMLFAYWRGQIAELESFAHGD